VSMSYLKRTKVQYLPESELVSMYIKRIWDLFQDRILQVKYSFAVLDVDREWVMTVVDNPTE
jgi:hypothetical protein